VWTTPNFRQLKKKYRESQSDIPQKVRDLGTFNPKCNVSLKSLTPETMESSHKKRQKDCKNQRGWKTQTRPLKSTGAKHI
jgi:predicted RNA-binding protein with RPS1 domain